MTTWVEEPRGGRDRGPRGLARAWVEVMVRPKRFFRNGVAPGDQAPGLYFAVTIALLFIGTRFLFDPASVPSFSGRPVVSAALTLLAVGLIVAPLTLHLTAALQTIILMLTVDDRAGVSETVQVVAYATTWTVSLTPARSSTVSMRMMVWSAAVRWSVSGATMRPTARSVRAADTTGRPLKEGTDAGSNRNRVPMNSRAMVTAK